MRKYILFVCIIVALVTLGGCSISNDYCCTSNDQCLTTTEGLHSCSDDKCGKCVLVEPLTISPTTLPDATVGQSDYSVELTVTGGHTPYTWGDLIKGDGLEWLTLAMDDNDNSKAWLKNAFSNGQTSVPSQTSTGIPIRLVVLDNTKRGTNMNRDDNKGTILESNIKINECGKAADCTSFPGDAACVEAACNAGKCDYTIKVGAVCLVGCINGFVYNAQTCNSSGICEVPSDPGSSCGGFACADTVNCKNSCNGPGDCAGALLCKADHTCTAPQPLGYSCTVGGECISGYCANKVCCKTVCGNCQQCNKSGDCINDANLCTGDCDVCDTTTGNCQAASYELCPAVVGKLCTKCTQVSATNFSCTFDNTLNEDCTTLYGLGTQCYSPTECRLMRNQPCPASGLKCLNGDGFCILGKCVWEGATASASCENGNDINNSIRIIGKIRIHNGTVQIMAWGETLLGSVLCPSDWIDASTNSCSMDMTETTITATYNSNGVSVTLTSTTRTPCSAGPSNDWY